MPDGGNAAPGHGISSLQVVSPPGWLSDTCEGDVSGVASLGVHSMSIGSPTRSADFAIVQPRNGASFTQRVYTDAVMSRVGTSAESQSFSGFWSPVMSTHAVFSRLSTMSGG